jgi:hypothetical protein
MGYKHPVTATFGVAVYGAHGTTKEELVSNADIALYMGKEQGRNICLLYSPDFVKTAVKKSAVSGLLTGDLLKDSHRMRVTLEAIEQMKSETGLDKYLEQIKELAGAEKCVFVSASGSLEPDSSVKTMDGVSVLNAPVIRAGVFLGQLHISSDKNKRTYNDNEYFLGLQLARLAGMVL